jgi:hypothetical protein
LFPCKHFIFFLTITDAFPTLFRARSQKIADAIGIQWDIALFDLEQFRMGMDIELEHGTRTAQTNVTNDDPVTTGKIALAHLQEFPDYYTRLAKLEKEAEDAKIKKASL